MTRHCLQPRQIPEGRQSAQTVISQENLDIYTVIDATEYKNKQIMALVERIGSDQVRLKIRHSGGLESGLNCQDKPSQRQNYMCVGSIYLSVFL